jgi:DNA mismatch endonuclease (patch repair protein)
MVTPKPRDETTRRRMSKQRRKDTEAELAIRRELHRLGMRFRLERRILPNSRRTADLVFPRERIAVFVDGCFWHGCQLHGTSPKTNAVWWAAKIDANIVRDRDTDAQLEAAGWTVVRVWEHEDPRAAAASIATRVMESREAANAAR